VTAQPEAAGGLRLSWEPVAGASGYDVRLHRLRDGATITRRCFACRRLVVPGLSVNERYRVEARPLDGAARPFGTAAIGTGTPRPATPPRGLAALSVVAAPDDQELVVTWTHAPTGTAADSLHVELFDASVPSAPRKVSETIVQRFVESDAYRIPVPAGRWAVKAVPENAAGFGPETMSAPVTVGNPCREAELCASVTPSTQPQPVRLVAQGFLHGLVGGLGNEPRAQLVDALRPGHWRLAGWTADGLARRHGVSRTQVLSDLWHHATAPTNGGFARAPWSNWTAWSEFVTATVRRAEAEGWAPDYWDVWNEPNGRCCPRFNPADLETVTTSRWLETFERAWRAIKAADPDAGVVGPSLSALQWSPEPRAPWEFDIETFLAHSERRGLRWDAITWHENNPNPSPGDMTYTITNVDRHLTHARRVIARHPGTVVDGRIFVNEYASADDHVLAGWQVGYFRAFEHSRVLQANRTCWSESECSGAELGGLFTSTGVPTATWWAHRLYADLGGDARMAVRSTSSWQLDGLAARDAGTGAVRVLLGRHWGCNRQVNPWCQTDLGGAPASLRTTIAWSGGAGPVRLSVSRLPAGSGPLPVPVLVENRLVVPVGGQIQVHVPQVADGDAIAITLERV
jgi:hypothetical protein